VGYRSSTSYGYYYSSNVKGVAVTYHSNYDITIEGPVYPDEGNQIVIYAIGTARADITFKYTPA
ncbi:Hypothetical predicted protein, partial [Paramuricea clavata]